MAEQSRAVITSIEDRPREAWDDPVRGRVSWFTLFSRDITPTDSMSAGIAELVPGGGSLHPHRHSQPEIYFIIEGTGILTIDGHETIVSKGSAVFIPGDADHCLRNESDADLKLFYVFPTDAFSDVVYRFPEAARKP
jgi:mannose-6-phosphate isomerase-like protein (cupin superfamily)